jgi:polyisoprenoid-binding protein YceI
VSHIFVEHATGTVPIVSGSVVLQGDSPVPVSVSAVLDPAQVKTDESDRDAALRSPDWFDTAKFPQWIFASTRIEATGDASFTMDGLLTVHGVAQLEQLSVTIGGTPDRPVYHAVGKIDRHGFGMSTTRLDPVIGNPVDVTLDVVLK